MFSHKELGFLTKQLNLYLKKVENKIETEEISAAQRELLEKNLITTVTIVNKLIHLQPSSDNKGKGSRLLIVDDVESMRKVHRHYFMQAGFESVDLAPDGKRAFDMMKKAYANDKAYELVVSDWEMPKVSGLDLLKKVREDQELWRTPFYLISGLSDKKNIAVAIQNGVTGYLVKPVNQTIITKKFKEYLK
ncbi:response regulator [Alteromonas sp. ASW11-130]|uniref:response regulator n=1 Tax=Alteromonas sp. ASW11-130 TaxID=3015775 RepID=UPI002241B6CB|nr:response regulator [Alteromonas sp. ASW11-130]MCW8091445.1 response regulator [Alteromonas sp. ASW11-130]